MVFRVLRPRERGGRRPWEVLYEGNDSELAGAAHTPGQGDALRRGLGVARSDRNRCRAADQSLPDTT